MGLFYLRNPNANALNVFLKDLTEKVCVNFTCKGRECIKENCTFLHPCLPTELKRETVEAIGHHFTENKKGWLSDYHFCRVTLPADVTAMLGRSDGPSSKKDRL
jgi:hypothetical protein